MKDKSAVGAGKKISFINAKYMEHKRALESHRLSVEFNEEQRRSRE